MSVYLRAIHYWLPQHSRTNEDLVRLNPSWQADAIYAKTGICSRPIAAEGETAADLGYQAAEGLFEKVGVPRERIDALLFCTQSPDYFLPTTACLLQTRLGLRDTCGAFDFNLGCSGFTYGLWVASALVTSGAAKNVLLVVADTYSKYCNLHDLATATIFGDGAAAALITGDETDAADLVGPTVVGTDGRGAEQLIVRAGGARQRARRASLASEPEAAAEQRNDEYLSMNGPEIFTFTLARVHTAIQQLLERTGLDWNGVDWFLFHQANRFMLEQLRKKMAIPAEKAPIDMETLGNTVSATIPILIARCQERGQFRAGQHCVLAGFGVGYSWAMSYLRWLS